MSLTYIAGYDGSHGSPGAVRCAVELGRADGADVIAVLSAPHSTRSTPTGSIARCSSADLPLTRCTTWRSSTTLR